MPKFHIKIWSNLIPGVKANSLPPPEGSGGAKYTYIMVGAWMPGDEVRVGASITLEPPDPALLPKLMARIAYTDPNTGAIVPIGTGTFDIATGIASMQTTVFTGAPEGFFYVLAWIDSNGSGTFDPTEMHGDTNGAFYIRIIPNNTSSLSYASLKVLVGLWKLGQPWASRFLSAFLENKPIEGASDVSIKTITNRTPRLTHNTGAIWNSVGVAPIRLNRFSATSELADKIRASAEFNAVIMQALNAGKPKVQGYLWGPETEHTFSLPMAKTITFTGFASDLHYAFGTALLENCKLYARVRKSDLELIDLDLVGKLNDLYDWNYNNDDIVVPWVRQAAEVQASFYPPAGQPHGAIYETNVYLEKASMSIHFNFR